MVGLCRRGSEPQPLTHSQALQLWVGLKVGKSFKRLKSVEFIDYL